MVSHPAADLYANMTKVTIQVNLSRQPNVCLNSSTHTTTC